MQFSKTSLSQKKSKADEVGVDGGVIRAESQAEPELNWWDDTGEVLG